jgi:NurA-like 5'-3' nuclease
MEEEEEKEKEKEEVLEEIARKLAFIRSEGYSRYLVLARSRTLVRARALALALVLSCAMKRHK